MRRSEPKARERILSDEEIRAVWSASDTMPIFGDLAKLLLLTGQRRAKVAEMRWEEVDLDTGVWSIPSAAREKGNPGSLVLPDRALEIIRRQPRIYGNPYVFPARGSAGPISGFNKRKAALDAKLAAMTAPIAGWTLHDLRRTARSLLSRAGVRPEVSERVLGHKQAGIIGVYDRHTYEPEMAEALRRLSALIDTILNPPTDNIVTLATRERAR